MTTAKLVSVYRNWSAKSWKFLWGEGRKWRQQISYNTWGDGSLRGRNSLDEHKLSLFLSSTFIIPENGKSPDVLNISRIWTVVYSINYKICIVIQLSMIILPVILHKSLPLKFYSSFCLIWGSNWLLSLIFNPVLGYCWFLLIQFSNRRKC